MKKNLYLFLMVIIVACSSDSSDSSDNQEPNNPVVQPIVSTLAPTLTQGIIKFNGKVLSLGSGYYSRGFCWNLNSNPTLSNSEYISESTNTAGDFFLSKTYASTVFSPNTTYHVRAYLVSSTGEVVYGEDITFVTLPKMNVNFKTAKQIYTTSATLRSEITVNLIESLYPDEKGVCFKTSPGVTIDNGTKITQNTPDYNPYEIVATGLLSNTTYYVRSYIKEGSNIYYSDETTFKTAGAIGLSGGYIFYDKGEFTDGWRYLEAAPNNLIYNGSNKINWGCTGFKVNQTQATMGSGLANTIRIVNTCSDANCAARLCDNYTINGLSDWFLPSEEEAMAFFKSSINVYNIASNPWNDVSQKYFWTSTESGNAIEAVILDGYAGYTWEYNKNYNMVRVRPIRRF